MKNHPHGRCPSRSACMVAACAAILMASGCSDSLKKANVSGVSTSAKAAIDAALCLSCAARNCYESCPQRAIEEIVLKPDSQFVYIIDPQKCTSCGVCMSKCPNNAIAWKR